MAHVKYGYLIDQISNSRTEILKRKFKQWFNNSTNTKKTNNNIISPQNIVHYNKQHHMTLEIKALALDRHNDVAKIDRLMGYQPPSWQFDVQRQYR